MKMLRSMHTRRMVSSLTIGTWKKSLAVTLPIFKRTNNEQLGYWINVASVSGMYSKWSNQRMALGFYASTWNRDTAFFHLMYRVCCHRWVIWNNECLLGSIGYEKVVTKVEARYSCSTPKNEQIRMEEGFWIVFRFGNSFLFYSPPYGTCSLAMTAFGRWWYDPYPFLFHW